MSDQQKYRYVAPCSRCDGTQVDPDDDSLACDVCDADGNEDLGEMTEVEAQRYPQATKATK